MGWDSNSPILTSAYALQTALFVPRINKLTSHRVVFISAPYSGSGKAIEWEGIPVLPAVRDVAGCDVLTAHYERFKADALISLADPFGKLKCAKELAQVNWFPWAPVDCTPVGIGDVTVFRESGATPIAMSRFGEAQLRNEGLSPLYCPHAVDTQVFRPTGDPQAYRDTVPGIGPDTFVIGIVGVNRGRRKAFDRQLAAFARFHADHPDSFLALHTAPGGDPAAVNLNGLRTRLGITGGSDFPDSYLYDTCQISVPNMNDFYNGIDVLSMASRGEGFGVPLIEAQAAGTPVICTDASAMTELCGAGWLVSGRREWEDGHCAWWCDPDEDDILDAYEAAWQAREDGQMEALGKSARAFAMQYDVDLVFEQYMIPVLDAIEERISVGR
jgi:glycosyltransferase involved in cell wall biosynthesis